MSQDQPKWGFPKFWKSAKRDNHGSGSTPRPEEKHRFHLRKSSSQSSLFQTKRNSRSTVKTVTDDRSNDPEWVPFHRSVSPRLRSPDLMTEMKGRLAARSPMAEEWKMAKDQSMLGNGRTFDQQITPEKMRLLESQRMLGNYRALNNQQSFQNGRNEACDTADHWSSQNFDNVTGSPNSGEVTYRDGQQVSVSRRLFDEKNRMQESRPRSCEHVPMSTVVQGVDGQNISVKQWMDGGDDNPWNMHRPSATGVTDGRMDTPGKQGTKQHQLQANDGLHLSPGMDRRETTRSRETEAISDRFKLTGRSAKTADHLDRNGAVMGHLPPQQDTMETINYTQVHHANGQHWSNKLALIDHYKNGEAVTGNDHGPLLTEQGNQGGSEMYPVVTQKMFANSPGQNTEKQIGNNRMETDYRSSGHNRCRPDGADRPMPRQMVYVATHGDVIGDRGQGIVHGDVLPGQRVETDTHKMDIYGRGRGQLPWVMQADTVDCREFQNHGFHQRYLDRSPQVNKTYQRTRPDTTQYDTERPSHGNPMSQSQAVQFNDRIPTRTMPSYHKVTQNQDPSDNYDEQARIEDSIRVANFQQQPVPGFRQAAITSNKSHVQQTLPGYKPLETKCRSPQETCTISTTSQDSGFEQRMQNYLADSQNQSLMSSILETSVSTPPAFMSGDSGDVKDFSHQRRTPGVLQTHQLTRIPLQVNSDWKHHKNQDVTDSSSEASDSDGSSDLFVPKSQSHYDLTKAYRRRATSASLRAKSHNQVWPRRDDISASDGEGQSMAKSSLVLLRSSEFVSAVNMAHQHHEHHRKHHHHRHGDAAVKQEQIRKFKSAENVVPARQVKRKSVQRVTEEDRERRTRSDHRDMEHQVDVSFDGKLTTHLDSAPRGQYLPSTFVLLKIFYYYLFCVTKNVLVY